ncbi:HAD family phosphatase [Candidatus Borrarchaeum sp.]|uniref:HAD family hydrolase n=1 Tax=Candidatus Borrarchaeum sp. TaxID=2846742 RepID=UPI00257A0E8A|nr:HAD family phosphatase [Candidatus Borrarchaeum sp.]
MGELKAVIFDWDGVLVPIRINLEQVFDYIVKEISKYGVNFKINSVKFSTIEALIKTAKKDLQGKDIPMNFFDKLQNKVLVMINEIFTKDALTNSLNKEVLQSLKQVRELGLKTGIFTINRLHIVEKILNNSNAIHLFDAIVTQDDFVLNLENIDKKEHLDACLERLQISGDECMVVGDRPIDILPAHEVNAITVGFIGSDNRHQMDTIADKIDYTIDSITKLYQIIITLEDHSPT